MLNALERMFIILKMSYILTSNSNRSRTNNRAINYRNGISNTNSGLSVSKGQFSNYGNSSYTPTSIQKQPKYNAAKYTANTLLPTNYSREHFSTQKSNYQKQYERIKQQELREKENQRERERQRERDKQRERQKDRQRDRERQRQKQAQKQAQKQRQRERQQRIKEREKEREKDRQRDRLDRIQKERQKQKQRQKEKQKQKEKSNNLYRIRDSRERRDEGISNNEYEDRRKQESSNVVYKSSINRIMEQSEPLPPARSSYLRQLPEEKQTTMKYNQDEDNQYYKTGSKNNSKTIGLVGLNNIGNTCFMNSILQCMFNLPKFNQYFLQNKHNKETQGTARVAAAYGRIIQTIRASNNRSENPCDLKNAISAKKSRFSGYAQQDAQEFLTALLQLLSLDLNRSKNPKYKELKAELSKNSLLQIKQSEEWWNYNKQRQNSIVCDYFTGQLLSRVVCSSCKNESIAFDNTWDFALNFSRDDNGQISKMIENFLKEEVISTDYFCTKCKSFRQCRRKFDFYRLPMILVLQIKRFSFGKYTKTKLNNRIKVHTTLDLAKFISESKHSSVKNAVYDLVGVVNHSGDINFGHYTAECKNPINSKWYNFNDSSVSQMRMSETFDSSSPYLLFYSKKN